MALCPPAAPDDPAVTASSEPLQGATDPADPLPADRPTVVVVVGAAPVEDPPRGDADLDDAPVEHAAARRPTTASTRTVRIRLCMLTIVDVLPKVVSSRSVSPEPGPSPVAGTPILAYRRPRGPEPDRMKACVPHGIRRTVCNRGGPVGEGRSWWTRPASTWLFPAGIRPGSPRVHGR